MLYPFTVNMELIFVAVVRRTHFGTCCRGTGKVEFLQVQAHMCKKAAQFAAQSKHKPSQDAAANLHLNF